jgi:hypothetical protein
MNPKDEKRFLIEQESFQSVNLPSSRKFEITPKSTYPEKLVKRTWKDYGGLLKNLSDMLHLNPSVAVAVLCVESRGKGFAYDGRMIIRFENHVFWRYWGKSHPSIFSIHFKFDSDKQWQGHLFRGSSKDDWFDFHQKGQIGEWEAFEFARSKHRHFALYSISMGMPQIMGFNHTKIGYKSDEDMFDSFSQGEGNQIIGLFDFMGETAVGSSQASGDTGMIAALRKKDFLSFALLYNGPGKAVIYADRIKTYYELFNKVNQENRMTDIV